MQVFPEGWGKKLEDRFFIDATVNTVYSPEARPNHGPEEFWCAMFRPEPLRADVLGLAHLLAC